jgi:hypothetical protein
MPLKLWENSRALVPPSKDDTQRFKRFGEIGRLLRTQGHSRQPPSDDHTEVFASAVFLFEFPSAEQFAFCAWLQRLAMPYPLRYINGANYGLNLYTSLDHWAVWVDIGLWY